MIIKEFESAGYRVKFKLLNASEYGVPQKRERVIMVGFRDSSDHSYFQFPKPTTLFKKIPLRMVINEDDNNNERLFFSERAVSGMLAVKDKMNKGRAQSLDEPCNTISSHLAKVSLNSTDPVLFINGRYRRFSSDECARIQSFPETFLWDSVSETKQLKAIGNAVPPVLMWHIAEALLETADRTIQSDIEVKRTWDIPYDNGEWVQLTLFEPDTLYISKLENELTLIGTCRTGIIDWIQESSMYCYPVSDDELRDHPELLSISRILIRHKKSILGYYYVKSVDIVVKAELNAYGYPTNSSKHKSDTKYLLFALEASPMDAHNLDFNSFKPILGKGVKA